MINLTVAKNPTEKSMMTSDSRRMLSVVENQGNFSRLKSPPEPEEMLKIIVMMIRTELNMDEQHCCRVKKLRVVNGAMPAAKKTKSCN